MSDPDIYTVGWICAILPELVAAQAFLDETYEAAPVSENDHNNYELGRIGEHNVVIAVLPDGEYGTDSAASVAKDMLATFKNIRIGLMVGIAGGAPTSEHDIRLGDIVVSAPRDGHSGVFQYDFGKTIQCQEFQRTRFLNQPPTVLRTAITSLRAEHTYDGHRIQESIQAVFEKKPRLQRIFGPPDPRTDILYRTDVIHPPEAGAVCPTSCGSDPSLLVARRARDESEDSPMIHYGLIASANQLMKDAAIRDKLAYEQGVLCFEMEAAGLMNRFPCLVVRGICDYSDSHKNKQWQGYAAMTAAAYAKDLLRKVAPNKIEAEKKLAEMLHDANEKLQEISVSSQWQQQRYLDDKDNRCLLDLRITDPRDDKTHIQDIKGGLLKNCYSWILEHDDFDRFRNDQQSRLLWIKGDPGKGKTMLLCGVLDHIQTDSSRLVSCFFCQATNGRSNTATLVLRGLIYMLVDQNHSLLPYVQKKYDSAGKALFEDANAWQALSKILMDILQDSKLQGGYLVIDALDECVAGLPQLLDFIVRTSQATHAKWLVSSRNWTEIDEKLGSVAHRLSLELNAESVSAAVESYIDFKMSELIQLKRYQKNLANEVRHYLSSNADNTFLWVSLVCQELAHSKVQRRHTRDTLESFPPGLDSLYQRMMEYISDSRDAIACRKILALASVVYRPISIDELKGLIRSIQDLDEDEIHEVIISCGSFLAIRNNRVSFVHQSAKDFLLGKASHKIFSSGIQRQHQKIFSKSLHLLHSTLKRDIYQLRHPGYPIDKIDTPSPNPLSNIRYSCIYWVNHLEDAGVLIETGVNKKSITDILRFLKTSYLQWLEALSLMHNIAEGVKVMQKLERVLVNSGSEELQSLAKDAYRFLLSQKGGIAIAPLQTYTSALIFSPTTSLIKIKFQKEFPTWIQLAPKVPVSWDNCLQTLEGHHHWVTTVAISADSRRIASGSSDRVIKLWDAESGACTQTLNGHNGLIRSVAISTDGRLLISGSEDGTVKLWDAESGLCQQTFEGHNNWVMSVAISTERQRGVSGSEDKTIKLWDLKTGVCLRTLEGHKNKVRSVAISTDGRWVVSGSGDKTIKLWEADAGACLQTLKGHSDTVRSVAISTNGQCLASGSEDKTVKLWDPKAGVCLHTLEGHSGLVTSVAISTSGRRVVSGSEDKTVKIWDTESGSHLHTLEGHSDWVISVAISIDGRRLVSGSGDTTIKLWDTYAGVETDSHSQMQEGHYGWVRSVAISKDGRRAASSSEDKTVKLWNTESGACLQTIGVGRVMNHLSFDPGYGCRLLTDIGDIIFDSSLIYSALSTQANSPNDDSHDRYSISADGAWIDQNDNNLVWLPPEYRPEVSRIAGSVIVVGCRSGSVWMMRLP